MNFWKKKIFTLAIFCFLALEIFGPGGLSVKPAFALIFIPPDPTILGMMAGAQVFGPLALGTGVIATLPGGLLSTSFGQLAGINAATMIGATQIGTMTAIEAARTAKEVAKVSYQTGLAIAFKSALRLLLQQFAYDTATWIASGDTGGEPMFWTEGWGTYLENIGSQAGGEFIDTLSQEWIIEKGEEARIVEEKVLNHDTGKVEIRTRMIKEKTPIRLKDVWGFDLCHPSPEAKLKITLGLLSTKRPKARCSFLAMKDNWEQAIQSPNFSRDFQNMFDPWGNEFGIALSLQTGLSKKLDKKINDAIRTRTEGDGFKAVTEKISGLIKTPGDQVRKLAGEGWDKSNDLAKIFTGTLADAVDTFVQTLLYKLFQKLFRDGMAGDYNAPRRGYDYGGYSTTVASQNSVQAAREYYADLVEPSFREPGEYDILVKLASCPNPQNPGPTDCVITEKLRGAIQARMSVRDAVAQGFLDANQPFGFKAQGLKMDYQQGYPYRSLVILRRHRILPVGWELAALYNKQWGTPMSLGQVLAAYDDPSSPLYHLVYPDWVLKAPANWCKREGPGAKISSEQVSPGMDGNRDGDFTDAEDVPPSLNVQRESWCADDQTCIAENPNGSCKSWGYCMEDKRVWKFKGQACEPQFSGCETFTKRNGKQASLLKTTLDWGVCNARNVGCAAYSAKTDLAGKWLTDASERLHFNSTAATCDRGAQGCTGFVKTGPDSGVNLLRNPSFESGVVGIPGVEDAYDGKEARNVSGEFMVSAETGYAIAGRTFAFSFYGKNCQDGDTAEFENGRKINLSQTPDWNRYTARYVYPANIISSSARVKITSATCRIDALKLEEGREATAYSDFGQGLPSYFKKAPDYLNCYDSDPANDSSACKNFALKCAASEVGCDKYTPSDSSLFVPAIGQEKDQCPASCAGYAAFRQSPAAFEGAQYLVQFIPKTAQTCTAQENGCDQFTNLDKASRGGESIEYDTYFRQCEKPGENSKTFFTWEGSGQKGYQLQSWNLIKDADGSPKCVGSLAQCAGEAPRDELRVTTLILIAANFMTLPPKPERVFFIVCTQKPFLLRNSAQLSEKPKAMFPLADRPEAAGLTPIKLACIMACLRKAVLVMRQ